MDLQCSAFNVQIVQTFWVRHLVFLWYLLHCFKSTTITDSIYSLSIVSASYSNQLFSSIYGVLRNNRTKLEAKLLQAFNRPRCSIMHITCSISSFCSLEEVRDGHSLLSIKSRTVFHDIVDILQSISANTCNCLCDLSLRLWNGFGRLPVTLSFKYAHRV